jgi:hypothetical protein
MPQHPLSIWEFAVYTTHHSKVRPARRHGTWTAVVDGDAHTVLVRRRRPSRGVERRAALAEQGW